jgi:hypothetical protein
LGLEEEVENSKNWFQPLGEKLQNQRTTTGSGYFKTLQELLGIPGTGSSLILIEGERG